MSDLIGYCHLCDEPRLLKPIKWCGMCKHYFCSDCRDRWWARFDAAVQEMINGREHANCCGPQEIV